MAPEHQICGLRNDWESSPYVYLAWQELYVFWNLFGFSRMILNVSDVYHMDGHTVLSLYCLGPFQFLRNGNVTTSWMLEGIKGPSLKMLTFP